MTTHESNQLPPRTVPILPGDHAVPYEGSGIVAVGGHSSPFPGCRMVIFKADRTDSGLTEADKVNQWWEKNPRALTVFVQHDPACESILLIYTLRLSDEDTENLRFISETVQEALKKKREEVVTAAEQERERAKLKELEDRHYINLGREYALRMRNLRAAEKQTKRGKNDPEIKAAWKALNKGEELTLFEAELEKKRLDAELKAAAEAKAAEEPKP